MNKELIEYLSKIITPERYNLITENVKNRTRYMTVILEDIYQPHNASAVLRSCDCFGVQDIHIIENENKYNVNPMVTKGATKWLDLYKYNSENNNTVSTINHLKEQGYRIIATSPHYDDVNLEDFDVTKGKFALMFGSEGPGLSKLALDNADEFMKIPMYGFTESFNISVSAAIILHHLSLKLRNSNVNYKLSKLEEEEIIFEWLKRSIKKSDMIIEDFLSKNKK
ncbi:MAG: RNA methyltransferase [Chlorobi bacterium]|nr:RNA methyltransferase [Chlorobiota bacterium]